MGQQKGNAVPRSQFHQDSVVSSTEGCMIAGYVTVKKVPGNFHITGHSVKGFSFVPEKINVTHSISHLSFGSQRDRSYKQRLLLQMAQQQTTTQTNCPACPSSAPSPTPPTSTTSRWSPTSCGL